MILMHGANSIKRVGIIYHTDFSLFDYSNKVDHPLVGATTSYNNYGKTYTSGQDGALVVTSDSTNTVATDGVVFTASSGSSIEAKVKMDAAHSSNSMHFLWLNGFGFDYEPSYYGTQINVAVRTSYSFDRLNGASFIETDSGYNWVKIPNAVPSVYNDARVVFRKVAGNLDAEIMLNGVVYVVAHSIPADQKCFIDPRRSGSIACKEVIINK